MFRWLLLVALLAVFLAGVGVVAVAFWPAPLVELALRRAGLQAVEVEAARLGFDRLEIDGLQAGQPTATLERLRVDFSLGGLLEGQLESLEATGLQLRGRLGSDGLAIAGLDLGAGDDGGGSAPLPERLRVSDALLDLETPSGALRVPFEVELRAADEQAAFRLELIDAALSGADRRLQADLRIQGKVPLTPRPALEDVAAAGTLSLRGGWTSEAPLPGSIDAGGDVNLELEQGRLTAHSRDLDIAVMAQAAGVPEPVRELLPLPWTLTVGSAERSFALAADLTQPVVPVSFEGPVALRSAALGAFGALAAEVAAVATIERSGRLVAFRPGPSSLEATGLSWRSMAIEHARLRLEPDAERGTHGGTFHVELSGEGAPIPGVIFQDARLRAVLDVSDEEQRLVVRLRDAGTFEAAGMRWSGGARAGPVALTLHPGDQPVLRVDRAGGEARSWRHALAAELAASEFRIDRDVGTPMPATADGMVRWSLTGAGAALENGQAALSGGRLHLPEHALALEGIEATVPFDASGLAAEPASTVAVARILHDTPGQPWFRPLALDARLRRNGEQVAFDATLRGREGRFRLLADGSHDLARDAGAARLLLDPLTFAPGGLQPQDLSPAFGGRLQDVTGTVDLAGELWWLRDDVRSDLALLVDQLSLSAGPTRLEQLGGVIRIDRPWPPTTPPGQQLAVGLVDLGLPLTRGLMTFRLEPGPALAVDRLRFRWAGGMLRAEPFTAGSDGSAIKVVLRAEGLDLAEIFDQVRLSGLSGQGTIDGTLPVVIEGAEAIIEGGELAARGPGWLRYRPADPPAAFEAGGESVILLLQALENFRYEALRITLDGRTDAEMDIGLHLKGANPDLYDGYPIEFNLDLEGELANVLRAGLTSYQLPERIRERIENFRR